MNKQTEFQEIIVKWLEENKLTQKEFAEKVGCTEATISNYVRGKRCPNHITLRRMERILGEIEIKPLAKSRTEFIKDEICKAEKQICELNARILELKAELKAELESQISELNAELESL